MRQEEEADEEYLKQPGLEHLFLLLDPLMQCFTVLRRKTEDGDEACEEEDEDFAEEVVEDEEEVVVEDDAAERTLVVRQVSEGGDGPSRVTEHHEVSGSQPSGSTISTTSRGKVWLRGPSKLPRRPYVHRDVLIKPMGEK